MGEMKATLSTSQRLTDLEKVSLITNLLG